ncbi:hypothetical protein JL108_18270 [Aeromicrobium sp. YIM 150415]|uniref:hypothetical protein n=1 Tax=Aeromicrobium sp. YIM 150415 TaxID=2803912 RepID=UPI001966791F|nr:hypothetical protein [Aeromicrobium sp. YIM 150415]MBM9465400.1 hypothetical protein [Aeromicrobium sp. YIM 150415]
MSRVTVPDSHPLAHIKLVSVDYESGTVSILRTDGQILIDTIPVQPGKGLVRRSTFIPADSLMEINAEGETLRMVLGTAPELVTAPVVYLDQNHWIDFARWQKNPSLVDRLKVPFFETLAKAANEERVILPLSSAHLVETKKRGGTSRLELAATMLRYSRGWQFRTVLGLRRAELRAMFGGAAVAKEDAVTLAPEAIFDMATDRSIDRELGPEIGGLIRRQTWANVLVSLLLDDQPDADNGAGVAIQWAESFAPLANSLRDNARAKPWSRDLTRARFFSDLGTDLPGAASESGMSPEHFSKWLQNDAETAVAATPGLGRLREVMHLRLSNADDKWERNDLNDWMYLSYAAGYCDLVLGEKKSINYLRRAAPRCSPGAILHRRAPEALLDLETLLKPS